MDGGSASDSVRSSRGLGEIETLPAGETALALQERARARAGSLSLASGGCSASEVGTTQCSADSIATAQASTCASSTAGTDLDADLLPEKPSVRQVPWALQRTVTPPGSGSGVEPVSPRVGGSGSGSGRRQQGNSKAASWRALDAPSTAGTSSASSRRVQDRRAPEAQSRTGQEQKRSDQEGQRQRSQERKANPPRCGGRVTIATSSASSGRGGRGIVKGGGGPVRLGGRRPMPGGLISGPILRHNKTIFAYGNYDQYYGKRHDRYAAIDPRVEVLIQCRGPKFFSGSHVLDLGCGAGLVSFLVAAAGAARVVGVDLDVVLTSQALKQLRQLKKDGLVALPEATNSSLPSALAKGGVASSAVCLPRDPAGSRTRDPDVTRRVAGDAEVNESPIDVGIARGQAGVPTRNGTDVAKFPSSLVHCRGIVPYARKPLLPGSGSALRGGAALPANVGSSACDGEHPSFPYNLEFRTENLLISDIEARRGSLYDVLLCLKLTKWVHLNWGDEGVKILFMKCFNLLKCGGTLVLEAQEWPSYQASKHLSAHARQNRAALRMRPTEFSTYLVHVVGFEEPVQVGSRPPLRRPMLLFRKPTTCKQLASNIDVADGAIEKAGVDPNFAHASSGAVVREAESSDRAPPVVAVTPSQDLANMHASSTQVQTDEEDDEDEAEPLRDVVQSSHKSGVAPLLPMTLPAPSPPQLVLPPGYLESHEDQQEPLRDVLRPSLSFPVAPICASPIVGASAPHLVRPPLHREVHSRSDFALILERRTKVLRAAASATVAAAEAAKAAAADAATFVSVAPAAIAAAAAVAAVAEMAAKAAVEAADAAESAVMALCGSVEEPATKRARVSSVEVLTANSAMAVATSASRSQPHHVPPPQRSLLVDEV